MPGQTDGQGRRSEFSGGSYVAADVFFQKGVGDGTNCLVPGAKEDDGSDFKPVKLG